MAPEEQGNLHQTVGETPPARTFYYGGQAVIEGVMIRGMRFLCVAARRPGGQITAMVSPLSTLYTGIVRRIPLLRGVVVLVETLVLGIRALMYSANVNLEQEDQEMGRWSVALMLMVSLGFSITVFFLLPLLAVQILDRSVFSSDSAVSDLLSNLSEGIIRLGVFLAYIWGIGFVPDIRRVFAYHGAEHMTVKAYEAHDPLETDRVRKYSTAHPRCGTAFLLVVMVLSILVFALLGRPPIVWRILSRVILIPVIAGLAYEVIKFSGAHQNNIMVRLITAPSLMLQVLTTRWPDDAQIEVAIHAMNTVIAADHGEQLPGDVGVGEAEEEQPQGDVQDPSGKT